MCEMAKTLDPSYSVPGRNTLNEVSGLLSIPKPTIATITNYLNDKNDENIDTSGIIAGMRKIKVNVKEVV